MSKYVSDYTVPYKTGRYPYNALCNQLGTGKSCPLAATASTDNCLCTSSERYCSSSRLHLLHMAPSEVRTSMNHVV